MSNRRTKWSAILIVGAVALSLAGCAGSADAADSEPSGSASFAPVTIGYGADAAYAPFFLADQNGLFEEAGLDVELRSFSSGGDAVTAVGTGQIELTASSNVTTTSQMANILDLTAFAKYVGLGRYNKVVLRDGIESAKDIEKFGYVAGLSQYAANKYLTDNGIDPASVELIPATAQDLTALMRRGDVDGFFLWEPWPTTVAAEGIGHIEETATDAGITVDNWIITNADWLAENEATAQALIKVLEEAVEIVNEDPEQAAEAVEKAITIDKDKALQMIQAMDFGVDSLTEDDVDSAEAVGEFFVEVGSISKLPDLAGRLHLNWIN